MTESDSVEHLDEVQLEDLDPKVLEFLKWLQNNMDEAIQLANQELQILEQQHKELDEMLSITDKLFKPMYYYIKRILDEGITPPEKLTWISEALKTVPEEITSNFDPDNTHHQNVVLNAINEYLAQPEDPTA